MSNNLETAQFGDKHTPDQTLIDAMNNLGDAKMVVVVVLDDEDYVRTSWSDGSLLKRMGMMDMAKTRMFQVGNLNE